MFRFRSKKFVSEDEDEFEKLPEQVDVKRNSLEFVLDKLYGGVYGDKFTDTEIMFLANILTNKQKFKKLYLNTDWKDFSKQKELIEGEIKDKHLENVEEGFRDSFSDESIDKMKKEENESFHVKLVLVDIMNTSASKIAQKIVSPILNTINYSPDFGIFHTALIIGPWLIEWSEGQICVPRRCFDKHALFQADITDIKMSDLDNVVDIINDCIFEWNTGMNYSIVSKKHEKIKKNINSGNCQDFVDDIFSRLGIQTNFSEPQKSFFEKLKKEGKYELKYETSNPAILENYNIKKSNTFQTHQELDMFVQKLLDTDSNFPNDHPNDYKFLKSFDRALWLRHYASHGKDTKSKPLIEDDLYCCPFGDPYSTGSLIKNK